MKKFLSKILTRRRLIYAGVTLLGLILIIALFDNIIMPWYTKHGEALGVPNVLAKRFEAAKDILEAQDLVAVKAGEKHDPNLPFGYVVEQNPRPDRLVKKGRRVYLTISVGEQEVPVPKLIGLSENNAREILKSVGLRVGEIEYEYVINELPDVVIDQSAAPNSLVKVSSEINLTVSLGEPRENAVMPQVMGKTLEVAKREIQKAGLVIGEITYNVSEDFLPNTVIDQSIEAGTTTKHGEKVDLLVTIVTPKEQ